MGGDRKETAPFLPAAQGPGLTHKVKVLRTGGDVGARGEGGGCRSPVRSHRVSVGALDSSAVNSPRRRGHSLVVARAGLDGVLSPRSSAGGCRSPRVQRDKDRASAGGTREGRAGLDGAGASAGFGVGVGVGLCTGVGMRVCGRVSSAPDMLRGLWANLGSTC